MPHFRIIIHYFVATRLVPKPSAMLLFRTGLPHSGSRLFFTNLASPYLQTTLQHFFVNEPMILGALASIELSFAKLGISYGSGGVEAAMENLLKS